MNVKVPSGGTVEFDTNTIFEINNVGDGYTTFDMSAMFIDEKQVIPLYQSKYRYEVNFLFQEDHPSNTEAKKAADNLNDLSYNMQFKHFIACIFKPLIKSSYFHTKRDVPDSLLDYEKEEHMCLIDQFWKSDKITKNEAKQEVIKNLQK